MGTEWGIPAGIPQEFQHGAIVSLCNSLPGEIQGLGSSSAGQGPSGAREGRAGLGLAGTAQGFPFPSSLCPGSSRHIHGVQPIGLRGFLGQEEHHCCFHRLLWEEIQQIPDFRAKLFTAQIVSGTPRVQLLCLGWMKESVLGDWRGKLQGKGWDGDIGRSSRDPGQVWHEDGHEGAVAAQDAEPHPGDSISLLCPSP